MFLRIHIPYPLGNHTFLEEVKTILCAIGGNIANKTLKYLDFKKIRENPKIFCGYSDITALNNSIFAKTGLVTYSGPHYSTFGQKLHFEYTLEYFKKCFFSDAAFDVFPSKQWSDDEWFKNQNNRELIQNKGFYVINEGQAEGIILGANLCTFNLLQGTEYFPNLTGSILFLEDDYESLPHTLDRDLQSLIHLPGFERIKGLIIGRFQKASKMTKEKLRNIIKTKKELDRLPVIGEVDFGHTDPKVTFPIGGKVRLKAYEANSQIEILEH